MVVREPDAQRASRVNGTVMNRAKPPWLKAGSADGWHGLVCLSESELGGAGGLKPAGTFDMGNLRGAGTEVDASIGNRRMVKKYEMPTDGRVIAAADGSVKIDYHYSGHKNVDPHRHYLVEVTPGRLMVVDRMGNPYASDLDLATRQRPGMKQAGDRHTDRYSARDSNRQKIGGREDDMVLAQRAGRGQNSGQGFLDPKTPRWLQKKRLVIFVPEWEHDASSRTCTFWTRGNLSGISPTPTIWNFRFRIANPLALASGFT